MRSSNSIASPSIRIKYLVFCLAIILIFVFVFDHHIVKDNQISKRDVDTLLDIVQVQTLPFERARFDNRRIIRIYDWMWTANKWADLMDYYDVCLSTQGSMDRIHWILDVVEYWRGPISLSVYITSPEEWMGLNLLINHFQQCYPIFRDLVSIHIAVPSAIEEFNMTSIDSILFQDATCEDTAGYVKLVADKYSSGMDSSFMNAYPQNHMRNIARKGCGTDWTLSTDIDIIPRPGSAKVLQKFYESSEAKSCRKCAFVIPTYELNTTLSYPSSKFELVEYWNASVARPFHFNVFMEAHNATDYLRWALTNWEEGPVKISHKSVRKLMKYYEPFYISSDTIPAFEERFIGYGFTRSSQVQEALSEGWSFKVLTPIFAVHWGMQSMDTLISPKNELSVRKEQTMKNSKIFKDFVKELAYKKSLQSN